MSLYMADLTKRKAVSAEMSRYNICAKGARVQ